MAVVEPSATPLIFATVGDGYVPDKSPDADPPGAVPEMVVLTTLVTLPWASVVTTGTCVADPYVPAVPVLGKDNVTELPRATEPPPLRPVPAVTVRVPLPCKAALAIDVAGREIVPAETVRPFDAVKRPVEVSAPPNVEAPVPMSVNVFPEAIDTLPLNVFVPVDVANVQEPLKAYVGLVVTFPNTIDVAFVGAMLIA